MKILILSNLCPPFSIGGYEIGCANVAAGLHDFGHTVCLATSRSPIPDPPGSSYVERCFTLNWFQPTQLVDDRVRQYALFHASVSDYTNTMELLRLLRSFDPDVVYVWNLFAIGGIALLDLLNTLGVPWVLHLMDNLPHHLLAGAPTHVRSVFGGTAADLFANGHTISMSNSLLEEVVRDTGIAFYGGLDIIPGWVDTRRLRAEGVDKPVRQNTRFVCASRISPEKGIGLILEAAALLIRDGVAPFQIDIFGTGDIPFYIDMAQRFGVQEIVSFGGQRPQAELLSIYQEYQAFLFPTSEREPFGFAPVEAAACGCFPILTRQCGAAERLVDGAHCLKIDRTAADLAQAMEKVIVGSVDVSAISRRAMTLVRTDLSFEVILRRIAGVLAQHGREWDRSRANDAQLPLLLHAKHHLAVSMMFGQ